MKGAYIRKYDKNMTKYEVTNFLNNYTVYINKLTFILFYTMAIILNGGIVLIQSGSKVTTYILNKSPLFKDTHQVCRHRHNEKEVVETRAKREAIWTDCREVK